MNQDGYTLAETLAALMIIGLAISGLVLATDQLGRLQSAANAKASAASRTARLSASLTQILSREGPFRSDAASTFKGDPDAFTFACGARTCGGEIVRRDGGVSLVLNARSGKPAVFALDHSQAVAFEYDDDKGAEEAWPPKDAQAPRTLHAIALMQTRLGDEAPLAQTRVWAEQAATCAFDAISRSCRAETAP